jgi:signal transduction histidine kinase
MSLRQALLLRSLAFFSLLTASSSYAVTLTPANELVRISTGVTYLVDTSDQLTFEQVLSMQDAFITFKDGTVNFGNSQAAYWLKVTIRNETRSPDLMLKIANSALDSITVWEPTGNGKFRRTIMGESRPFFERPYLSSDYILPFSLATGSERTLYLRIKNDDLVLVPMAVGVRGSMQAQDKSKDIFWGIYIGLMLAMLFYNAFIYISTRDSDYVFYIFYVLAVLLTQTSISGYAFQLLWPHNSIIAHYSPFFAPVLVGVTSIMFARQFLRTKIYTPGFDKLFYVLYVTYSLGFLLALAGKPSIGLSVIDGSALLAALFILYVAIRIVYRGYRPAVFFLAAWSVFLVGVFVFVFKNFNLLPYNNFTIYTMPVGAAMEVILLSFALADKINILKKEKAISQAEALREAEKYAQLIRSQNLVLETKVNERTAELYATNNDLKTALTTLQGAQAQLVESEKMASLGQLTAGIAHEINNPINFVISNVKPLKRDMMMLTGMIKQIETAIREEQPSQEQLRQHITRLKEEVEYDYMISEIDFLLKGISEGSERTAEIVKGLRIFARVDEYDIKITNVHDGIDFTLIILNTLLADKIKVEKQYGPLSIIECYPGKLNQALLNIITNGIHAIRDRFGDQQGGCLVIKTWDNADLYNISIRDNGCGISEEVGKKMFDPFFSTKEVGEGTGLGLSIAYNIIKKHNGQISFTSAMGEGTEFLLTIPVKQSNHA